MDEDIEKILNKVFSVDNVRLISNMVKVVERDMSDSSRAKRINDLDYLLNGVIK